MTSRSSAALNNATMWPEVESKVYIAAGNQPCSLALDRTFRRELHQGKSLEKDNNKNHNTQFYEGYGQKSLEDQRERRRLNNLLMNIFISIWLLTKYQYDA